MTDRVLHRWTDSEGRKWECDAYDHGPFCRLCQPVKAEREATDLTDAPDSATDTRYGADSGS